MNEREAYIALNMMEGVGPATVQKLVEVIGSPAALFKASESSIKSVSSVGRIQADAFIAGRRRVDWGSEQEKAERESVRIIARCDAEYPEILKTIYDPPLALYIKGRIEDSDRNAIAVVGSRRVTHYGTATAEKLAAGLCRAGYTVVSGLAEGIDTAAHKAALEVNGRTLAVTGGGLDCVYPVSNISLAEEISGKGAMISEYPFGRKPDRSTFPMRNRIVSGLSRGVIVVEAGRKSGALITANQAIEQGRDVFAVPGRIDSRYSEGCNELIRSGACLVTCVDDVLEEYEALPGLRKAREVKKAGPLPGLDAEERMLVELLRKGETDVDALVRMSGMAVSSVNSLLMRLELKKVIRMLPGRMVETVQDGAC